MLFGTLGSLFKQIEAPYVFDWENAIALDTKPENRATSRGEGKVSWVFSSCVRNLGYILELQRGCPFQTGVCSMKSGHLSRYEGHIRNVNYAFQDNTTLLEVKWEFRFLFLFCTVILGFLSIFMKSQASSPFEALNSACLSNCQRM